MAIILAEKLGRNAAHMDRMENLWGKRRFSPS
jgi:hypothetical protein